MAIIDFFDIAVCAEIVSLLAALFLLRSKQKTYWILFIIFLIITLMVEGEGYYLGELKKTNHAYYNFLMIVQVLFYSLLFFKFQESEKTKLWPLIALSIFIIFFTAEGLLVSFSKYNGYSRMLLSCIVVFLSCTFYFSLIKDDRIKTPLKHPPFWIVTGLFFYYFGSLPMFAFIKQVSQIKLGGNISFYTLVMGCLSCILYGSWIIGFICRKKQVQ